MNPSPRDLVVKLFVKTTTKTTYVLKSLVVVANQDL